MEFLKDAPLLMGAFFVASLIGVSSYAFCREMEKHWEEQALLNIVAVLTLLVMVPLIVFWAYNNQTIILALNGFCGLCVAAGWCHRKSGGYYQSLFASFWVMLASSTMSVLFGLVFPLSSTIRTIGFTDHTLLVYALGLVFYPLLSPVACLAWQSLRIRPGVDEAFDNGS